MPVMKNKIVAFVLLLALLGCEKTDNPKPDDKCWTDSTGQKWCGGSPRG